MRKPPLIHRAAENNDFVLLEQRIALGDPVDKLWLHGFTPLHLAAYEGHEEMVKGLIELGADVNLHDTELGMTALQNACVSGNTGCVRTLLASGAHVNARAKDGWTALMHAADATPENVEMVRLLLEHGAKLESKDKNGSTALHEAARSQNAESCRTLVLAGADVSARDRHGLSPSDIALFAQDIELAKWLHAQE